MTERRRPRKAAPFAYTRVSVTGAGWGETAVLLEEKTRGTWAVVLLDSAGKSVSTRFFDKEDDAIRAFQDLNTIYNISHGWHAVLDRLRGVKEAEPEIAEEAFSHVNSNWPVGTYHWLQAVSRLRAQVRNKN